MGAGREYPMSIYILNVGLTAGIPMVPSWRYMGSVVMEGRFTADEGLRVDAKIAPSIIVNSAVE